MIDNDTIIEKAKRKIGDLDQATIREQDTIDIRVSFKDAVKPIKYATVRFYRDKMGDIIVWDHAEIIERS